MDTGKIEGGEWLGLFRYKERLTFRLGRDKSAGHSIVLKVSVTLRFYENVEGWETIGCGRLNHSNGKKRWGEHRRVKVLERNYTEAEGRFEEHDSIPNKGKC